MQAPAIPSNEARRLASLKALDLLDTPAEQVWDRLVQVAATVCDVPISLVSIVDTDRQWFKARFGLDAPETGRDISFCGHAILGDTPFVVPDAAMDDRFSDNPLVTGAPDIRFYAGIPLSAPDGAKMGTLCVIDRKPRQLTKSQEATLKILAAQAEDLLALRASLVQMRAMMDQGPSMQANVNQAAHNIATPLTPILMRMALLKRNLADRPDCQADMEDIQRNLKRLREALDSTTATLLGHDRDDVESAGRKPN